MPAQTDTLKLVILALLAIAAGLAGILFVWQLVRTWRRHDTRHRPTSNPNSKRTDAWQASGHRLETKINNLTHDDLDDEP